MPTAVERRTKPETDPSRAVLHGHRVEAQELLHGHLGHERVHLRQLAHELCRAVRRLRQAPRQLLRVCRQVLEQLRREGREVAELCVLFWGEGESEEGAQEMQVIRS